MTRALRDFRTQGVFWSATAIAIALFAASLFFDSLIAGNGASAGWMDLLLGWLGMFALPQAPAHAAWLANLAVAAAWIALFMRRDLVAGAWGCAALLLALLPLISRSIVVDESGVVRPIEGYGAGYWLWLSSMIVTVLAALAMPSRKKGSA